MYKFLKNKIYEIIYIVIAIPILHIIWNNLQALQTLVLILLLITLFLLDVYLKKNQTKKDKSILKNEKDKSLFIEINTILDEDNLIEYINNLYNGSISSFKFEKLEDFQYQLMDNTTKSDIKVSKRYFDKEIQKSFQEFFNIFVELISHHCWCRENISISVYPEWKNDNYDGYLKMLNEIRLLRESSLNQYKKYRELIKNKLYL